MKTLRLFLSICIIITIVFSINSCKKEKENITDNTQPTPTKNFKAKVNDTLFQADVSYMYLTNPSNSYSITINTQDEYDIWRNWSLQFFSDDTGTFLFTTNFPTPGVAKASYSVGPSGNIIHYNAINGSVKVTKIDTVNKKISGTFSFTGADENNISNTISITEGSFTDVTEL